MPVQQLNHAVLFVSDVGRSVEFYTGALEFRVAVSVPGRAAFLIAAGSDNDHDLGLFQVEPATGPTSQVGLYHLAWEVDTLGELRRLAGVLDRRGALVGASDHATSKSLYARDPDGIELEVEWMVPPPLLTEADLAGRTRVGPLDFDAEIARFGADAVGGLAGARVLQAG